jgi:hypothetical protein
MKSRRFYLAFVALEVAMALGLAVLAKRSGAREVAPQALWVVNGTGNPKLPGIAIFGGVRLTRKTGTVASNGILSDPADGTVEALAFDNQHNLWISMCTGQSTSGLLIELSVAGLRNLASSGSALPKIAIEAPVVNGVGRFLVCPHDLAFDQSGNLWVEAPGGTAPVLLEYVSSQLSSSQNNVQPTPLAIAMPPVQTNFAPVLTFDQAGNLWQSGGVITGQNQEVQQTVVEYTAAQVAAGLQQTTPNQTLIVADTSATGALNAPSAITFDATGNLWVAFALGGSGGTGGIEMIAAGDLAGQSTVTPTPTIILGPTTFPWGKVALQSFATPDGLAFDNQGDLWVANQAKNGPEPGTGSLVEFAVSELTASGNPVPVRAILANKKNANLGEPIDLVIGPVLP